MIFVTVGTHEQPFNRLIEYMDLWAKNHDEKVIIQTGYSTYEPKYCECHKLLPYSEMEKNVAEARIVITHGGPSSFIMPLQIGKTPIVVPRRHKFGEHVNDHQVTFCETVAERMGMIIVIEDVEMLGQAIVHYDARVGGIDKELKSNNDRFCKMFEKIVNEMMA
jgi:UDP-N-acetylglucosamine transferase subunit ALG13